MLWEWGDESGHQWRITSKVGKVGEVLAKVIFLQERYKEGDKWLTVSSCSSTSHGLLAEVVRVVQRMRDRDEEIRILREELANLRAVKEDEEEEAMREINAGLLGLLADGGYSDGDDEW